MMRGEWRAGLLLVVAGTLALGAPRSTRADDDDDPPGRVARLNYMKGSVSLRPASVDDWTEASSNYPLTTGDHLWTDRDSRGEVHLGGSVVRLGSETAFSFLNLDDRTAQMRITDGVVSIRVTRLEEDEVVEVDTPNAAVSLLRPGFYRIDVGSDGGDTVVTTRSGEAEVTAGGSAFPVRSRESAYLSGDDSPTYDVRDARRGDEWEDWCEDRDRRAERSTSSRYVSREMVGYSDLDDNGSWREDSEYGAMWIPTRVSSGWAPYREGHWSWVYPWGWTWVDDYPWGFAPFHYGRWAYSRGVWGWCPGTIVARPVYAPALVAFIGGGSWSASVSISDGVGWFPLGPREVYVPPYGHSRRYVQNVNVTQVNVTNINITNVNNVYVNRGVKGAVTAVPRNEFGKGRSFGRAAVVVPVASVRSVQVSDPVQFVAKVPPRKESVVVVGQGKVPTPPERVMERRVVARIPPPPPPPKFQDQGQKARAEAPRTGPNPLVRAAVPVGGAAAGGTLKPARSGLPKAEPVSTREIEARRPTKEPGTHPESGRDREPNEKAAERPTPRPGPTPRPEPEDRPSDHHKTEKNDRPTPKPHATPKAEPEERPTPKPTPTPRAESDERPSDRHKPKPTPTPKAEPEERPTPRPTPTPRPDHEERHATPRDEPQERPTPRPTPTPKPEPKPTPKPEPKPTPKPTPKPSPTPK